ncbi:MAG: hypothetical protein ACR2LN_04160 [Candidatus Levyibacteriota bacterium]
MLKKEKNNIFIPRGQALITLLFFTIIGITATSAAVVMILVNSLSGTKQQQGEIAYEIAQSGADDGLIRLLRDPTNYSGETLNVGSGSATIIKNGSGTASDPYIIMSKGQLGVFTREIQVSATYQNNLLQVTSRKEVYQ